MINNNVWVDSNKFKLEAIKRHLIEDSYKTDSSPDALNPMYINNMLDGAIVEIIRLQKEVDSLKLEVNKKQEEKKPEEAKKDE